MMGGAFVTNVAEKLQEICKKKIDTEVKIRYTYIRWCEFISNSKFNTCIMREWLSGGAPPCQGGGRGFDPRLALFLFSGKPVFKSYQRFVYRLFVWKFQESGYL